MMSDEGQPELARSPERASSSFIILYYYIADFEKLGLDPLAHKIVVVKIGYLVPDLKRAAPRAFLALSPGAVDQAIERLPYQRIRRPIYPVDPDMTWQPE
jgi:microcystin degradation protein MlrC